MIKDLGVSYLFCLIGVFIIDIFTTVPPSFILLCVIISILMILIIVLGLLLDALIDLIDIDLW